MDGRVYILKGKDCTNKVRSIRVLSNGKYEVFFKNDNRRFIYNQKNVVVKMVRSVIDGNKYVVEVDGKVENNIQKIKELDGYYQLIFKSGFVKSVPISKTKLISSCLDDEKINKRFEYFKTIAREISLYTEKGKNILGDYYDKIDFIRKDTILSDYLDGEISDNYQENLNENIFPFEFNPSQKIATENAMNYKVSVIQGPPGTGKTQTILNIIANIVKENKTVAVVSNNNSAIDNVNEKLQKYGIDFIAARLGNSKNKEEFILNQYVPEKEKLESWVIGSDNEDEINQQIRDLTDQINEILKCKNKRSELETELDNLKTEKTYFNDYSKLSNDEIVPLKYRKSIKSNNILDLWRELDGIERDKNKLTLWKKVKFWLIYKVEIDDFFKQDFSKILRVVHQTYYDVRLVELINEIKKISDYITDKNLDNKISKHKKLSQQIFQSQIAKRYLKNGEKKHYELADLWKHSEEFIKDYPVVFSTTYSLRNSLAYNYVYDYVIVDESSQVDLATFVLALSCGKRVVVVGDEKQLPNVINGETLIKDIKISSKFDIPNEYRLSSHSALSSITNLFKENIPIQLLREHYRCHPKIIGFCNKKFYNDQLIILTPSTKDTHDPLKIYKTVKGNHARNHINERQIDVTFDEIVPNEKLNLYDETVGIVTPYRNHAQALCDKLKIIGAEKSVLAATVDKFQGRERNVIIINTVDNQNSDFASNPNRLNVAISRARNQLIVVINGNDNSTHTGIDDLVEYIKYNNFEIIKSDVRSIFDYLYTAYYQRLKLKEISSYLSENLMFDLINKLLIKNKYTNLECIFQYPLKMLVNTNQLFGREKEYASNDWTKVDFVIFKKTSKMPVLAIEVDGWNYHYANTPETSKQQERDINKNNILNKFNIPIVRFSTTGGNEEDKLLKKLNELMGTT